MFIQFHELWSITINSRGAQEIFLQIHRGLSNRRNLFDTNDYAFMIFLLSVFAIRWDTANCGSEALFAYFSDVISIFKNEDEQDNS